jgi:hypothetical protein
VFYPEIWSKNSIFECVLKIIKTKLYNYNG